MQKVWWNTWYSLKNLPSYRLWRLEIDVIIIFTDSVEEHWMRRWHSRGDFGFFGGRLLIFSSTPFYMFISSSKLASPKSESKYSSMLKSGSDSLMLELRSNCGQPFSSKFISLKSRSKHLSALKFRSNHFCRANRGWNNFFQQDLYFIQWLTCWWLCLIDHFIQLNKMGYYSRKVMFVFIFFSLSQLVSSTFKVDQQSEMHYMTAHAFWISRDI